MTTLAGYITDRRCPSHPEHGNVHDMNGGGYYCPHHDHDHPVITKNFWTEDEFQDAKSATTPEAPGTPQKIAAKPRKRVAKRTRR